MRHPLAMINISMGILMIAVSIPLTLRKVKMNRIYGVRFPESFKSDKNWYDINAAGGWVMMLWTMPIFLWGLYGFMPHHWRYYYRWNSGVVAGCVVLAALHSYLLARRIDRRNNPA